jgi:hypothetical protein
VEDGGSNNALATLNGRLKKHCSRTSKTFLTKTPVGIAPIENISPRAAKE